MLGIVLLLVSAKTLLVSGNPLLIPLQTCSQGCNQNCPNQQNPSSIPVIVSSNPVQQLPNSNNQLYQQTYGVQNQLATPYQNQVAAVQNQPVDSVNQLNQLYMNKMLTNPTVQNLLEQANLYSQLGIEVPTQTNNGLFSIPNVPSTAQTPHVVNNYFILPPEYFEHTHVKCPKAHKKDNKDCCYDDKSCNHDSDDKCCPDRRQQQRCQHPGPNRRQNGRRCHSNNCREDRNFREGNDRRQNQEGQRERNTSPREQPQEMRQQQIQKEKSDETVIPITSAVVEETPEHTNPDKPSENVKRKKRPNKEMDDAFIADLRKKYPALSEELISKLLKYMRSQFRNQANGLPFALNYDQLFQRENQQKTPKSGRRRPADKSTEKSQKTVDSPNTDDSTVTSTATQDSKDTKPNLDEDQAKKSPKNSERRDSRAPKPEQESETPETTESFIAPDPDTVKTADGDHRMVPEYYPDFTQDQIHYDSGEYNVRNLRDDRYYYTTDRSYETTTTPHEYYMRKLKNIHKTLDDSYEDVLSKPDTKSEKSRRHDIDDRKYQTTSKLDGPEFRTKQVIRHGPKPDHVNEIEKDFYKASTYSDAKTPPSIDNKSHKINGTSKKVKPDNIETVYGHSKVVKYGKTNEESEENGTPIVTYYLPDNMQYEEDGKTVVIAKSIPADHFW